jgi:cell division protein FtsX
VTAPGDADAPFQTAVAAPEGAVTRPASATWRKWSLLAVVVAFSMLVGAGAATGMFVVTGLLGPAHRFAVNLYLKRDATADQKAAIEAALPAFKPVGEVKFENREEAWRKFQDMAKDRPDVLRVAKKEDMPESFRFETKGRLFDCTGYAKVRHMPGVDNVQVIQQRMNNYAATITCDAEYETP